MAQFDDGALDNAGDGTPKRSKKGLVMGVGVAVAAGVGMLVMSGSPSLSAEEEAVFLEAQNALRSDDYQAYPAGEGKLIAILEKYPGYVPAISWLMQLYCAWGEELRYESQAFQLAAQARGKELADLKKTVEQSKSKKTRAQAEEKFTKARVQLEELNKAGKVKDGESTKMLAAAKTWARKGSEVASQDPQLQRAMADYARITEKWPDVETRLEYVKRNKPDSAGYRFIKGVTLMQRDKKHDEALVLLEEAFKIDPQFTKAQYFIGLTHDHKGDRDKAADAMKKVLQLSPGHPGARAYLGLVDVVSSAKEAAHAAAVAGTDQERVDPGDEVAAAEAASPASKNAKASPKTNKGK
jgi:tetratricopeptide (TPR) repeat protein